MIAPALTLALTLVAQAAPPAAHAVWVDPSSLALDGDPSEWRGTRAPDVVIERPEQFVDLGGRPARELWTGPEDASLRVWVGWNDEDLVLGGEVFDADPDYDAARWFQGDSLELFLNTRGRDPTWGPGDFQMMLAPDWADRPWGVYPHEGQSSGVPRTSDGGFGGVEISSARFVGGYRFEARIPWRNFGGYVPHAGAELPFNFAIGDRDGHGQQESYGTWTGEKDVAMSADRRGTLVLDPGSASPARTGDGNASAVLLQRRSLLLALLALAYGIALASRRVWRSRRARRVGVAGAAILLLVSGGLAAAARWAKRGEAEERRAAAARSWDSFESLLASGALGHPEPARLIENVQALLSDKGIAPVARSSFQSLAPEGFRLVPGGRTARRAIPFDLLEPIAAKPGSAPASPGPGLVLSRGEECVLTLPAPALVDAVHLVTRVSDRRFLKNAVEQVPVLSIEVRRNGELATAAREVRHRQDLHHEEDEHVDHPGLEPALYAPGGRLGNVHADGLLLEFDRAHEIDQVIVRHIGPEPAYAVVLLAVAVRSPVADAAVPAGMRATASGEWRWSEWRSNLEAEVTPLGRAPKKTTSGQIVRALRLGQDPVALVHLRDVTPGERATRWDFLPIALLAALAPFLVALFAEGLATRPRIRGKLAVGFAVSSAVPLLALTLLLEASLAEEHDQYETERAQAALVRADQDLERDVRELEREAQDLLRVAELGRRVEQRFPETSEELVAWWGEGRGEERLLERTAPDGRKVRTGTGSLWRQIPRGQTLRSGPARPWGQLLLCGVAQTSSGAELPMTVLVARPPRLPGSSGPAPSGANDPLASVSGVRLIGAGRDPAPSFSDLTPALSRELRRPVFGAQGDDLVGVLSVERRERGVPVLGEYTLTELLLAAGITAVFTALLFAGILTGHIVGPIERLDRAVREGRSSEVTPEVADEVGHLTSAIQSFTAQVAHRVRQLETLQVAQEDLSRRLDLEQAREAALAFFAAQSSAAVAWLVWCGEVGEEPKLFGEEGRSLPLPRVTGREGLFQRALASAQVLHFANTKELPKLDESERLLLGPIDRILALPLLAGGECRGSIVLGFRAGAPAPDLAFLRTAAAQAAIVLENARLYQQAVVDSVTGFLSDPGFRQRVIEEIQRAEEQPEAGVLLIQIRLTGLPKDDARATGRLREAAKRMRLSVRGLAVFGRSGSADLKLALPWTGPTPNFEALEKRLLERISSGPWPDGESVSGLLSSHAAWPTDGPSSRFVMNLLEERLGKIHAGLPSPALTALRERLPTDFIAGAHVMVQLLETTRRMAEQEMTVLISGETGVGKDRLAEIVHRWSPRRDGPLVHIHCPSLTGTLIEDELFGHEKGAFTGAHTRRVGPFEYASGGTVVLDEVGGLSAEGQVALLRLLETREVLPLGSARAISLDVRILATTSRDLSTEVERGQFRSDLYFRLNVAQLSLPPLRLRRQAIPELVASFVRRFNTSASRPVTGVSPKVLDVLFDHAWPGNVRELENVLARGLTLAGGGELSPEHIDLEPAAESPLGSARGRLPLNERQRRLLEKLAAEAQVSSTEYADQEGISARTALRDLLELVEAGLLSREGQKRGTRFRRSGRGAGPRIGQ